MPADPTPAYFPPLETPCPECEGNGWIRDGSQWGHQCGRCNGEGYFATEFGKAVLAIIERHLDIDTKDVKWKRT